MASAWGVLPIFLMSTLSLYWLSFQSPSQKEGTEIGLKFPTDMTTLKEVAKELQAYSEINWLYVLILFSAAYTYKQAFCIPGSGVLNLLGGALFGLTGGMIIVCLFTAIGATLAFLISKTFYRDSVRHFFPDKVRALEEKVEENRHQLWYWMLFIRVVPVSPGWAINLVSPLLQVPLHIFFVTTLIGLIPYNFLGVSAGRMLTTLKSVNDIFTWNTFLILLILASILLIPTLLTKRNKKSSLHTS